MIKYLLSFLFVSQSLFAFIAVETQCAPAKGHVDSGYSVTIFRNHPSVIGHKSVSSWSAKVNEETIAGEQTVIAGRGVKPTTIATKGGPLQYKGQEFLLSIQMVVAPRPDHKHPATLNAVDDKGHDVEEKLLCTVNK